MTPEKRAKRAERVEELIKKLTDKELIHIIANRCEPRNFWFIISSLRGPDIGNDRLKWLTTARIRSILKIKHGWLAINPIPLSQIEMIERDELLSKTVTHFREHYFSAVVGIRNIYKYDLLTETEYTKAYCRAGRL